jgi:hypothetical protein
MDEMNILYRGTSINASYQVSLHLAKGFQRRRLKCEKLTADVRQVMAKAHIAFTTKDATIRNKRKAGWLIIRIMCPYGDAYQSS